MTEQRIARMERGELVANAQEIIDAAGATLSALCHGERWRMSVPVQDDDSDVTLGAVIRLAKELRDQLDRVAKARDSIAADALRLRESESETEWEERLAYNRAATAVEEALAILDSAAAHSEVTT